MLLEPGIGPVMSRHWNVALPGRSAIRKSGGFASPGLANPISNDKSACGR